MAAIAPEHHWLSVQHLGHAAGHRWRVYVPPLGATCRRRSNEDAWKAGRQLYPTKTQLLERLRACSSTDSSSNMPNCQEKAQKQRESP